MGRRTFKINTSGNQGKEIDERKTSKRYSKKKIDKGARRTINEAAIQKFGSKKKAKSKGKLVGKKTKFKNLSGQQKKTLGVKGKVNNKKELNALRQAIGYKVDRSSDKAGSIRFAISADKQKGQQLSKKYKNQPTEDILSKLDTNTKRVQNAKDKLKGLRKNDGTGDLTGRDLGLNKQFGELQGQFSRAIEQLNDYEPDAALRDQLKTMQDLRAADAAGFNEQIGNLNTMVNNLEMGTADLVKDYEAQMADDRKVYNTSIKDLKDAYSSQAAQAQKMNDIYAEQQRRSKNLRRAYVPTSNRVAGNPLVGDRRKGRKASDRGSSLSSLTISTGLGKNANPLAGLQLA